MNRAFPTRSSVMAACLVLSLAAVLVFFGAFACAVLTAVLLFGVLPVQTLRLAVFTAPAFQPIALLSIDSSRAPPVL